MAVKSKKGRQQPTKPKGMSTMGDVFIERMVKKKFEGVDALILVGIMVGIILAGVVGFVVGFMLIRFPALALLAVVGAVFGGYKLLCTRLLEYEYSLTNGFISVDKILNRQNRKRMVAFECDTCEDIGVYSENEERLKNRSFDARVFATQYSNRQGSWYMVVHSKKLGKTLVVFDPDEDLQEAIKKFIPRPLKFEKFGRN